MSAECAELRCETCVRVTDHELRYAGRLLESIRCTRCGSQIEISPRVMVPAYVHDLEQRLTSKPGRIFRRAVNDPVGFALSLPLAVVRQPAKFVKEFWSVLRR